MAESGEQFDQAYVSFGGPSGVVSGGQFYYEDQAYASFGGPCDAEIDGHFNYKEAVPIETRFLQLQSKEAALQVQFAAEAGSGGPVGFWPTKSQASPRGQGSAFVSFGGPCDVDTDGQFYHEEAVMQEQAADKQGIAFFGGQGDVDGDGQINYKEAVLHEQLAAQGIPVYRLDADEMEDADMQLSFGAET
eukprot:167400-Pyramimonas_sp.AAC.1